MLIKPSADGAIEPKKVERQADRQKKRNQVHDKIESVKTLN